MKTKLSLFFVLVLGFVILFAGCESAGAGGGSDDTSSTPAEEQPTDDGTTDETNDTTVTTKNVPSKFSVDPPQSLRGVGSVSGSQTGEERSYAYEEIKQTVSDLEGETAITSVNFVVIDEVVDGLAVQADPYEATSVTLDESVVDRIQRILEDSFGPGDASFFDELVGQEVQIGTFYYRSPEGDKYDVAFEATITFPDGFQSNLSYFWSEDKRRVRAKESFDDEFGAFSVTYVYDDDAGKSTVQYQFDDDFGTGKDKFTLEEKSGDENNGVYVTFVSEFTESVDGSESTFTYDASGFADDNGGFLEAKIEDPFGSFRFKEGFDGEGNLTYLAEYDETSGEYVTDETYSEIDDAYVEEAGSYEEPSFDVTYAGVSDTDYFVLADTDLGASFAESDEAYFSTVGDAIVVGTDLINVLLWEDIAAGTTLYVYKEVYDEESDTFTYEKQDGTIEVPTGTDSSESDPTDV